MMKARWREVLWLTLGMLPSADELLQLMKREVDGLVAGDEKIQECLQWVDRKTQAVDAPYKPAAVRAFYLSLSQALNLDFSLSRILEQARSLDLDFSGDRDLSLSRVQAQVQAYNQALNLDFSLDLVSVEPSTEPFPSASPSTETFPSPKPSPEPESST